MGSTVFVLLVLSSGYLFLRRWRVTRASVIRSDGHALYFSVVIAALALVLNAALVQWQIANGGWPFALLDEKMANLLRSFATEQKYLVFGETALWSVLISAIYLVLLNEPIRRCESLRIQLYLRLSCLAELEEFLLTTSRRNLPVMVTLASKKVYVGFSIETPDGREQSNWVRLEPLLSGYRDDEYAFKHTTNYGWLHADGAPEGFRRSDFDILLPASDIVSVHAFDLAVYVAQFGGGTEIGSKVIEHDAQSRSTERSPAETQYWGYVVVLASLPLLSHFAGLVGLIVGAFLALVLGVASALEEAGDSIAIPGSAPPPA
jgi:hypothetical protein